MIRFKDPQIARNMGVFGASGFGDSSTAGMQEQFGSGQTFWISPFYQAATLGGDYSRDYPGQHNSPRAVAEGFEARATVLGPEILSQCNHDKIATPAKTTHDVVRRSRRWNWLDITAPTE